MKDFKEDDRFFSWFQSVQFMGAWAENHWWQECALLSGREALQSGWKAEGTRKESGQDTTLETYPTTLPPASPISQCSPVSVVLLTVVIKYNAD